MKDKEPSPVKLAELYETYTSTEIADMIGEMSPFSVLRRLRKEGVKLRPRGRRRVLENPGKEVLNALFDEGYSQAEAAKKLGVSKRTIQRWKEENLEL